jgi:hypothetical protein
MSNLAVGPRLAQQRSFVAAQPRAFELDPQPAERHAAKDRKASRSDGRSRKVSYTGPHLFAPFASP